MTARSLSLREKRLIQVAILLVIVVLISLLLRGGGSEPPQSPEPIVAPVAAPTAATYAGPPPPVAAVPPAPPPVPAADASQLKLYGLLASGAVIGYPAGGQRLVPVGREALPGLTLVRVEQSQAVFQGAGGEVRLGFDGVAAPVAGGAAPPLPAAPGGREENLRYRLGLAPRVAGNQITGYVVRANVEMPALARAGVQPGDVIVAVNGQAVNEQMVLELARIVASPGARFDVERGGQRLQLSLRPR